MWDRIFICFLVYELGNQVGNVGYNNKILVFDGKFSLGKNENVNLTVPVMKGHKTNSLEPTSQSKVIQIPLRG